MLLDGLPADAAVLRPESGDPYWSTDNELASMTVELLANMVGREATIERPGRKRKANVPEPGFVQRPDGGLTATGLEGMLGMAQAGKATVKVAAGDSGE